MLSIDAGSIQRTKKHLQWIAEGLFQRGVGNTQALINGPPEEAIIVGHTMDHARTMAKQANFRATPAMWLNPYRGNRQPVIIDHHAVQVLAYEALHHINQLEREIQKLKKLR